MKKICLILLVCGFFISSGGLAAAPEGAVKIAQVFIAKLVAGDYSGAGALFDHKMKQALPPEKLKEVWLSVIRQSGLYQKELKTTLQSLPNDQVVIVSAKFVKTVLDLQIAVNRSGVISGFYIRPSETTAGLRPKTPEGPFLYARQEVSYINPETGNTLAGTLTIPPDYKAYPVVLLISGSGSQDRDETIMGHKPFLIIADYLSRRGIGVLRVDDRGVGGSTGNAESATTADLASDVLAGVKYLRNRSEVQEIGLLGHSEGGVIAPMVALKSNDVAFIILAAGPGLPGEEILKLQKAAILKAEGAPEPTIEAELKVQAQMLQIAKCEANLDIARERLAELLREYYSRLTQAEPEAIDSREQFVNSQVKAMLSPWMKYFLNYDPRPALERLKCPVLAINGSKDTQVVPEENLAAIAAALQKGGNKDYTVRELPNLNHLFQTAATGAPGEYGEITETFSLAVLELIDDWIAVRVGINASHSITIQRR